MIKHLRYILCGLLAIGVTAGGTFAANTSVSRAAVSERARASGTTATRNAKQPVVSQRSTATRSGHTVAKRASVSPNRVATTASSISRVGNIIGSAGNAVVRRALGLSRNATSGSVVRVATTHGNTARSAAKMGGASRARATAVFSDVSKLGDGYNQCRDAYNTCMDQFCAGANETYRRCYCSNTFRDFRDREDALDAATTLLAQFENNNLNAVNKTAEEVNAMYSATEGEMAIKNDTSGAAALLNDIGDLLSGKKKATSVPQNNMMSMNGLSIDFSGDLDDIWGASSSASLFTTESSASDLSTMEGAELYNNAHTQCMQLVGSVCDAGAVRNMAKSAYSILITQDCNVYQKKIDAKAEQVKTTVRTAEKYLREARLEEYRAHNSADVNECLDKVEKAMLAPTACDADYVKCLDYSGVYINSTSGEPIYSPRLFKLNELITLDGVSADVLIQNPEFNQFLDSKRMYAQTALDSCRGIADTVWLEFKRNALIKISQAQDEKIEEVKMSCVSTMKECYDAQSGALKSFDDTTAQSSGALAARASRDMCSDKVMACAALYGDTDGCVIDVKTNKVTTKSGKSCGLQSLMNFVDTVDDVRIAEGCATAVQNYLKDLCTPTTGDEGYPWNCRLRNFGGFNKDGTVSVDWANISNSPTSLTEMVARYTQENCGLTNANGGDAARIKTMVEQELSDMKEQMTSVLAEKCDVSGGMWVDEYLASSSSSISTGGTQENFYNTVYGTTYAGAVDKYSADTLGKCIENTIRAQCDIADKQSGGTGLATYNETRQMCEFSAGYYEYQCSMVGGMWDGTNCYL